MRDERKALGKGETGKRKERRMEREERMTISGKEGKGAREKRVEGG